MHAPRLRFRVRTLVAIVAVVARALTGLRILYEGPEAHWLLLELTYGNAGARRSAAVRARELVGKDWYGAVVGTVLSGPSNPPVSATDRRRRRLVELLRPALVRSITDPDAACRSGALGSFAILTALYGSDAEKGRALQLIIEAMRDRDASVRKVAVASLIGLHDRDVGAAIAAIRTALVDPSIEVRQAAIQVLSLIGVDVPETQPEVAAILIPLLASGEDSRVRSKAAWGLCYFGTDRRRHPPGAGPDVVPALVAALRDPDVDVRRTAADILRLSTTDARGRVISHWGLRKAAIMPALTAAISDNNEDVRVQAALALFNMGERSAEVITLIEQGARDPDRKDNQSKFGSALEQWQEEQGMGEGIVLGAEEDDGP